MSEYTPITGELRDAMRQWGWVESDGSVTFTSSSMPPSIDAEQSLAISGSDFDRCCDAIDAVHRGLERENAALKAELDRVLGEQDERDGWVQLPKDADGAPINIGDVMVYADGNTCPLPVVAIVPPAVFLTDEGPRYADMCRHQPDTWERIIEDALSAKWSSRGERSADFDALVARCKALCERTREDV